MVILILLAVAGMIFIFTYLKDSNDKLYDFVMSIGLLIIVLILMFMPILFVSLEVNFDFEYKLKETTYITALKDNQDINGRFYICGGYMNEDLYYYYAEETKIGIKTDKVRANSSYIIYSDEKPKIETYKVYKFKNWYDYIYAIPIKPAYHKIYAPKGTVTNEFNVDLE